MKPRFFRSPDQFRAWLEQHHEKESELLVGFYKKDSGKKSITWSESVDEALCFGWIDGVRKSRDQESYTIRFTPRRPTSIWSAVNISRHKVLTRQGRMTKAGRDPFDKKKENKVGIYSYEQRPTDLMPPYDDLLRKNPEAWDFFASQPPGYRKTAIWWIVSAKRENTRLARLATLIECCGEGTRIPELRRSSGKTG